MRSLSLSAIPSRSPSHSLTRSLTHSFTRSFTLSFAVFFAVFFSFPLALFAQTLKLSDLPYVAVPTAETDVSQAAALSVPDSPLEVQARFGLTVQAGPALPDQKPSVELTLKWTDGAETPFTVRADSWQHALMEDFGEQKKDEKIDLPDSVLEIFTSGGRISQHVRPNLGRFHSHSRAVKQYGELLACWDQLPAASVHPLKIEFRQSAPGTLQLFLDGSFIREIRRPDCAASVQSMALRLAPTAALRDLFTAPNPNSAPRFLPLDLTANPKVRAFLSAEFTASQTGSELKPGFQTVDSIPLTLLPANRAADVGICREGQGNWALEVDEFTKRTPLDAFPSAIHVRVPAQPYCRAWVVFALDPDGKKDPILTTRLGKFLPNSGSGNNYLADTTIEFNAQQLAQTKRVGQILREGKTLPVYFTSIPLDLGKITDCAVGRDWKMMPADEPKPDFLDFEFFGKPLLDGAQTDRSSKPDPASTSSVQILAATLECAPVSLDLVQSQPGNLFLPEESSEMTAVLRAAYPADGTLSWTVRDVDGNLLSTESVPFTPSDFDANGRKSVPIRDLRRFGNGFFRLDVTCSEKSPNASPASFTHHATFVNLPKDERRARYDSPYGLWWFAGVHFITPQIDFAGPMLFKCGIRNVSYSKYSEAEMAPYCITKNQRTLSVSRRLTFLKDDLSGLKPEAFTEIDREMSEYLEKWPHIREICIFHESGPGWEQPYELYGEPMQWQEGQEAHHRQYAAMLNHVGQYLRQKYPTIKLVVGNSGPAIQTIGAACRFGGDPKFIDFIGNEATGQQFMPEKPCDGGPQAQHLTVEVGRIFTGQKLPVTGCHEFTARTERGIGWRKQAEWYVRDLLIGIANNYSTLGIGGIIDPGNAYHDTLWGSAGLCERSPYAYPKPACAAIATLTNVFDQARFTRQIPTGSTTVYALEASRFTRKPGEGQNVYAFWCARGNARISLLLKPADGSQSGSQNSSETSSAPEKFRLIDLYGRETSLTEKELTFTASTSPCYLICDSRVESVQIAERAFPEDLERAQAARTLLKLDSAERLTLSPDAQLDTKFKGSIYWPVRRRGEFTLKTVSDDEKGSCVEVALDAEKMKDWNRFLTPYVRIDVASPETRSDESKPYAQPARGVGVWVKGNSNWGRILFEIEDSDGEIWRSNGVGGWGCDAFDWPAFASVNFDGWNFVSVPLCHSNAFDAWSPDWARSQWNVSNLKNRKIDGPIQLKAIFVESCLQKLNLRGFEPVDSTAIRLRDFGIF